MYKIVVQSEATVLFAGSVGSVIAILFTMYRVDGRMDVDDPRELVVVYPAKYDVSVVMVVVNFTLLETCVGVSTPSFVIVVIIGALQICISFF